MLIEVVPLREEHIAGASRLFNVAYREERSVVPLLPARYEDQTVVEAFLTRMLATVPGVVALDGNCLVGFMAGFLLPSFRGARGIYCPELAHAAQAGNRKRIYHALYKALSSRWIAEGYYTHAITSLAHQNETIETFFWLGFGMTAEDGIRDLNSIKTDYSPVEIRRADGSDVDALTRLHLGMRTYMEAPPIFRINPAAWGRDYVEGELAKSPCPIWVALQDGIPAAFLSAEPDYKSSCRIIQDEKTISLTAAFTEPSSRKRGFMTALLNSVLNYARSAGFVRCSVDYEPENLQGASFWSKHFTPVCHSLIRTVDRRAGRQGESTLDSF